MLPLVKVSYLHSIGFKIPPRWIGEIDYLSHEHKQELSVPNINYIHICAFAQIVELMYYDHSRTKVSRNTDIYQ